MPRRLVTWPTMLVRCTDIWAADGQNAVAWSQNATNIVSQKYLRGQLDSPARERSVKQMIGRVAGTIADWGRQRGYFASAEATPSRPS